MKLKPWPKEVPLRGCRRSPLIKELICNQVDNKVSVGVRQMVEDKMFKVSLYIFLVGKRLIAYIKLGQVRI